jgi:hypothetical protein
MIKPQIGADRSSRFGHRIVSSEIDLLGFDRPRKAARQRHCHVWTAPADQGLFCGGAFDRGCGHVFGLSMRVLTPRGP